MIMLYTTSFCRPSRLYQRHSGFLFDDLSQSLCVINLNKVLEVFSSHRLEISVAIWTIVHPQQPNGKPWLRILTSI